MNANLAALDQVKATAIDLAMKFGPKLLVAVVQLADSSVNIGVKPWVNVPDYVAAGGEINKAIVEALRARGVAVAPPRRDVRMLANAA